MADTSTIDVSSPDTTGRGRVRVAPLLWALLELFALTGLVVAQPLLDVTGKAPDFFILHSLDRTGILLLVAVIALLPPLAMWAAEAVATLLAGERGRRLVHLAMMAVLFVLLAVEAGKKLLPLRGKRLALAALLVGGAAALLYQRWSGLKLWLRYLAPAPLVFVLVFVLASPASALILPSKSAGSAVPAITHPGRPLPPVVLILFDEFPLQSLLDSTGHVDRRVYPNFARFAADSTWYRNATGIAGWTPYAVPAMLRGRYPDRTMRGAAPVAEVYPDNLFTLFGHYYNLKVFETVTQLCPPASCGRNANLSGFGTVVKETAKLYRNIASPVDVPVDTASVGASATTTVPKSRGAMALFGNVKQNQPKRLERFLSVVKASDPQPTLYFLHVLLPHSPWKYLPDGRTYDDPIGRAARRKDATYPDAENLVGHQRQLLQLAYTDTLVGKLLDRLKSQGLYDRSLVLMTADHGSGFSSAATSRSIGGGNEPTLMWVPLFIKTPHQAKGRIDDRNWEHVDLLPTIADIAGLSIPWKVDGFSETGPPRRQRSEKWWYQIPGRREVLPGPANWAKVLHGVTDTLVRAKQNGLRGFYQLAPNAAWIYRAPQEIGQVTGTGATVEMRGWDRFKTMTPGAARTAELIVGKVTSGVPPSGAAMAIAVNGKIAGTGAFYPPEEGERPTGFVVMVPDFLFAKGPGQPQIQAYIVTRAAGRLTLQPATITG